MGRFGSAQGWGGAGPPLCPPWPKRSWWWAWPGGRRGPRAPTARRCGALRAEAGRRWPRLLAAPRPKRPTALKKQRSYLRSPPPSGHHGGEPRPWHCWCSASGPGCEPGELAAATGDDVAAARGGASEGPGGGRARRPRCWERYAKTLAHQANQAGPGYLFCPGGADRSYYNFVNNFCYHLRRPTRVRPRFSLGRARSSFICDHLAAGTPLRELLYISGISEVESLLRYARHVPGAPGSKGRAEKKAPLGVRQGQPVPACSSLLSDEAISFCAEVTDSSGVASKLEALLAKKTGRPRQLKVRALLVALLLLALDDRPLHIKAATKLLFYKLPGPWRDQLGINGDATGRKAFLARYRQARYLFHLALSAIDPSPEAKGQGAAGGRTGRPAKKTERGRGGPQAGSLGEIAGRLARGVGQSVLGGRTGRL